LDDLGMRILRAEALDGGGRVACQTQAFVFLTYVRQEMGSLPPAGTGHEDEVLLVVDHHLADSHYVILWWNQVVIGLEVAFHKRLLGEHRRRRSQQ
jgi:hypothetical protein